MKILVFGSLNIDKVYTVPHFVEPGQTVAADAMTVSCGGKGFNQAIALARAGREVWFAGAVGKDGDMLVSAMKREGIHLEYLHQDDSLTGHAVIQVDRNGANSIIILAGANGTITQQYIDEVLSNFAPGDFVVLQNEISNGAYLLERVKEKGMLVALNPSPMDEDIKTWNLSLVDFLLVNETEGRELSGKTDEWEIVTCLHKRYPSANILLTIGSRGSRYLTRDGRLYVGGVFPVKAVDTTAAGDTFAGYFLSEICSGIEGDHALRIAAAASSIAVCRNGAAASIPYRKEVEAFSNVEYVCETSLSPRIRLE